MTVSQSKNSLQRQDDEQNSSCGSIGDFPRPTSDQPEADRDSRQDLVNCLKAIEQEKNTYQFVLLRHAKPSFADSINHGDIDLLGSDKSSFALLNFVSALCRQGYCHFRLTAFREGKRQLTLFSRDGRNYVRFDLWTKLQQFASPEKCLTYQDCLPHLPSSEAAFVRLPVELEASIYIQHLQNKRKNLSSPEVQFRLGYYQSMLKQNGVKKIAEEIGEVAASRTISSRMLSIARSQLKLLFEPSMRLEHSQFRTPQGHSQNQQRAAQGSTKNEQKSKNSRIVNRIGYWLHRLWSGWLYPFRRPVAVSIIGCDGSGKTSLAEALVQDPQSPVESLFTGKKLYRRSVLYQLVTGVLRRLTGTPREHLDDRMGIVLFLRAAFSLRFRLLARRLLGRPGPMLIDRSLTDFLIRDRKTDHPHVVPGFFLSRFVGERIPCIHLYVDHETLSRRKSEMTPDGHRLWDELMMQIHSERIPTDYVGLYNGSSIDEAVQAISRILVQEWRTSGSISNLSLTDRDRQQPQERSSRDSAKAA